ncbi:MAG: hypothetical protein KC420_09960 [Myxococcales bacterium]|nr:hypothetical protein [Myxococcales bacterium]
MPLEMQTRASALAAALVVVLACGGASTATDSVTSTSTSTGSGSGSSGSEGATTAAVDPAAECPVMASMGDVSVTGTTPFGDFTGSYAAYGAEAGDCAGAIVIAIIRDTQPFLDQVSGPADNYFLRPLPFDGVLLVVDRDKEQGAVGELFVKVVNGDESVWGMGTATLTKVDWTPWDDELMPVDPWPQVEGTFVIDDAGIVLEGSFVAPFCEWLMGAC